MMSFIYKKLNNRKGFSLIELIVVIAILGILAAVAIPRVTTSLATAKTNTDLSNLRAINNAVELYYVDKSSYPSVTTKADFATALVGTFPGGIPKTQDTAKHFWYNASSTKDKVVYEASAPEAVGSVNWLQID